MSNLRLKVLIILSSLWTLFTLAIVAWWMVFTVGQLESVRLGRLADPSKYLQQERMIKAEGGALLFLLVIGGVGLVVALWQLKYQHQRIREFFSVFTHEIKTSLSRLILKSDLLAEEHPDAIAIQKFKEETVFFQNQIENALWVAQGFGSLFWEKLDWSQLLKNFEWSWPSLSWNYEGSPFDVRMDRRLFQMILRNLVQNSLHHGGATQIHFKAKNQGDHWVLQIEDNGKGFQGDFVRLGAAMERQTATSGTGIGLWVVQQGVQQMKGNVRFYSPQQGGFGVELVIPIRQGS